MKDLSEKVELVIASGSGFAGEDYEYPVFLINEREVDYLEFIKHLSKADRGKLNSKIKEMSEYNYQSAVASAI